MMKHCHSRNIRINLQSLFVALVSLYGQSNLDEVWLRSAAELFQSVAIAIEAGQRYERELWRHKAAFNYCRKLPDYGESLHWS